MRGVVLDLDSLSPRYRERVADGDWYNGREFCLFDETIGELSGRTLGIIGYGVLGQAVAQAAQAFSMDVQVAQSLHGAAGSWMSRHWLMRFRKSAFMQLP